MGFFEGLEEQEITFVLPTRPLTETPAGWGNVFQSLRRNDHEGALRYNDYVVIHIDTDVQEETGFGVTKRDDEGKELTVTVRVEMVIERLKRDIDRAFFEENSERIVFAIAVDTIECWLLPLYDKGKAQKITGCLDAVSRALRKAKLNALWNGKRKFLESYNEASIKYKKRKTLMACRDENPSLQIFLARLEPLLNSQVEKSSQSPNSTGT